MQNLKKNTLWSVVEFAAVVFIQFFVMRYIISVLGISALGIWAVLMSAAQLAGFFDFGTSAGIGRFLARAHLENDIRQIEKVLATILYVTIPLYLTLAVVLYVPFSHGLGYVLQASVVDEGRALLIFAIGSYVAQVLAGTFSASLIGLHLGFRKSQIAIAGISIQAMVSLTLIHRYGLQGLAIAQITNYLFVILSATIVLKIQVSVRFLGLLKADAETIRSVVKFGAGLQVSTIAWGLFESSIRFIMSRFGGIEQVGYYEIAYRISSQSRVLGFYVGLPLSPALVTLGAGDKSQLLVFYRKIYARFSLFAIMAAGGITLFSPVMSLIMLGHIEPVFILFSVLTACGAMAHIAAIPSEITAVALGVLRYNIAGTLTALGVMLGAGFLFGTLFHGVGVAAAVLCASLSAASIPLYFNNRAFALPKLPSFRRDLALRELLRRKSITD